MSRKIILIKQELLLLVNNFNCRGFGPLLEDKLCLIFNLAPSVCRMTFPILASLLVRLVVLLPFQLLRLSLATPSRWTPLALSVFLICVVSFFFSSRRRHTRCLSDWSSDVCSSDLVGGDRAWRAIACKQARNVGAASARCKTGDTIIAPCAGQTDHRRALAASGSRCQARNAVTAHTRRRSSNAADREARCAGRRRCGPGTSCGAQGCAAATKGLPARKGHGGRERSARV